jgi:adenine-specific DNA-methyltransferase
VAHKHAAVRTAEYLYHQLIPYIGNKRKLLPLIAEAIRQTGLDRGVFLDAFAGSGVVSRLAKTLGFIVISNDWEPYAYELNKAYIDCNTPPEFTRLGGVEQVFETLNTLPPVEGYITKYYCPMDDSKPNPAEERMFYTRENGMRIDAMREKIAEWEAGGLLTEEERAFLLASFVYAASYVSNTSGVFKAFHNGWGGDTRTALYRILSKIKLNPPITYDNGLRNTTYKEDTQQLVNQVGADITYLDPPYNQHPYGSNYHLLNTIVLWDKPKINRRIRIDGKPVNKSAIRTDWRKERRSLYNYKATAEAAFRKLIHALDTHFILVSYSSEGIIPVDRLVEILADRGAVSMVKQRYKRYRVSSQRYSYKPHSLEYVLTVDCNKRN